MIDTFPVTHMYTNLIECVCVLMHQMINSSWAIKHLSDKQSSVELYLLIFYLSNAFSKTICRIILFFYHFDFSLVIFICLSHTYTHTYTYKYENMIYLVFKTFKNTITNYSNFSFTKQLIFTHYFMFHARRSNHPSIHP